MKAWRLEAAAINLSIATGEKQPRARTQMRQRMALSRSFKPKGSGNWLLDGLLIRGGFKAAVYGDPIKYGYNQETRPIEIDKPNSTSIVQRWVNKAKAWWNS